MERSASCCVFPAAPACWSRRRCPTTSRPSRRFSASRRNLVVGTWPDGSDCARWAPTYPHIDPPAWVLERWLPVPSYEGLYAVSNFGRVESYHKKTPRLLNAGISEPGYPLVVLCKNREQHSRTVHSLVLEAFAGPRQRHSPCRTDPPRGRGTLHRRDRVGRLHRGRKLPHIVPEGKALLEFG